MNNWKFIPLGDGSKMIGMVLEASTLGWESNPSTHTSVYSSLSLLPHGRSALEVHIERQWRRPYLNISSAVLVLWIEGVSIKEADEKHTEIFNHVRECPDIEASNGKHIAECSHYLEYQFDNIARKRVDFFNSRSKIYD